MSASPHDLSKLRITRDDPPPALRRAVGRNLVLALFAIAIIVAVLAFVQRGGATPIQVVTVTVEGGGGGVGRGSPTVTANGYVVARTRAAVSAKVAGPGTRTRDPAEPGIRDDPVPRNPGVAR